MTKFNEDERLVFSVLHTRTDEASIDVCSRMLAGKLRLKKRPSVLDRIIGGALVLCTLAVAGWFGAVLVGVAKNILFSVW